MILTLDRPILIDGRPASQLTLRDEPLGSDLWDLTYRIRQTEGGAEIDLRISDVLTVAARMADLPPGALKALSGGDVHRVFEAVAPFCVPGDRATSPAPPANSPSAAPVVSPPER